MEQQDLMTILHQHGVNTATLAPMLTRRHQHAYQLLIEKHEAMMTWHLLRTISEIMGLWPIIIDDDLAQYVGSEHFPDIPPDDIIQTGLHINPERWLRERFSALELENLSPGPWPSQEHTLLSIEGPSLSVYNHPFLSMFLLPTTQGWEAAAYLNYGGINECPLPEEQVALMHSWYERYGAEPMTFLRDAVQMHVARPPRDHTSALHLAREHFIYAPDIVYQGTQTLPALAATLLDATTWSFWWD